MFVNDEHLVDFTHRGNPDNISVLSIKGSVHILETEYLGSLVGVCLSAFFFILPALLFIYIFIYSFIHILSLSFFISLSNHVTSTCDFSFTSRQVYYDGS